MAALCLGILDVSMLSVTDVAVGTYLVGQDVAP